jgi:hypothetical protein
MQAETMSCSLTGAEHATRLQELREVASEALSITVIDSGTRLRFENTAATHADLVRLIEAESKCCSFLSFDLRVVDRELLVEITAPGGPGKSLSSSVAAR